MSALHLGPYLLIAQMTTTLLIHAQIPNIVNNHPSPIAEMIGSATIPPTQLNIFLTKLLTATPLLLRFDKNSVSIVVEVAKIIIEPRPKKKLATMGTIK